MHLYEKMLILTIGGSGFSKIFERFPSFRFRGDFYRLVFRCRRQDRAWEMAHLVTSLDSMLAAERVAKQVAEIRAN